MTIAVVNQTELVPTETMRSIVRACAIQIEQQFALDWSVRPSSPVYFGDVRDVPAGVPIVLVADEIDDPDALGYHTQNGGHVSGVVGVRAILDAGGSAWLGDVSVSCVLSHEILETHKDPFVNMWASERSGRQWAFELSDPVEGSSYEIQGTGISVSNYVLPWFFSPEGGSRFDRMGILKGPFSIAPKGYAVVREVDGTVSEIGMRPAWKVGARVKARMAA